MPSVDAICFCSVMQVGKKIERAGKSINTPPGLFFQHAGHRYEAIVSLVHLNMLNLFLPPRSVAEIAFYLDYLNFSSGHFLNLNLIFALYLM